MDPREHSSRSVAWGFQWLQSFVSRMQANLHWRLSLELSQGHLIVTRGEGQGGNVFRLGLSAVFVLLDRRDRSLMYRLTSRMSLI